MPQWRKVCWSNSNTLLAVSSRFVERVHTSMCNEMLIQLELTLCVCMRACVHVYVRYITVFVVHVCGYPYMCVHKLPCIQVCVVLVCLYFTCQGKPYCGTQYCDT